MSLQTPPPLTITPALLALAASRNQKKQIHRIIRHHTKLYPAKSRILAETCNVRNAQNIEVLGEKLLKSLNSVGWPRSKVTMYHARKARATVTTSSWKHLWMGWARSKQRYVAISRPRGLLSGSWQRHRGALSQTHDTLASRGLPIRSRRNKLCTCATWTVRERMVLQALLRKIPDIVTVTNQSMMSRNVGRTVLLVCWDIWRRTDLTCNTLPRTS